MHMMSRAAYSTCALVQLYPADSALYCVSSTHVHECARLRYQIFATTTATFPL